MFDTVNSLSPQLPRYGCSTILWGNRNRCMDPTVIGSLVQRWCLMCGECLTVQVVTLVGGEKATWAVQDLYPRVTDGHINSD